MTKFDYFLDESETPDMFSLSRAKEHVTLPDQQYIKLATYAACEVRRLSSNLSLWNEYSSKDGVEIFERKSDLPFENDSMFMLVTSLPCSQYKLEKLVSPWLTYRLQWDAMLVGAETVAKWSDEEVYLVRHLVAKITPLSARDSVDSIKIMRNNDELTFGATSAIHGDYPPSKQYVRSHQYLAGYFMRPCDTHKNHTKFHMIIHTDVNLPGPRFISTLTSKFKPRIMAKKIENLRDAIYKFDI